MRILGHIHTLNDEEVIDRSLQALLDQSYPVKEIVLVDNGSTDGTLRRAFPEKVTVIRHPENRGTSGAVVTGFQYALAKQYDWIWLFDADSSPRADALEKLVTLYRSLPPELQAQTWLLASLPIDVTTRESYHGIQFTPHGPFTGPLGSGEIVYECHGAIWTGSLYKVAACQRVGLPPADYVLDWGECEYGYRGKRCGYRAFMHRGSIIDHNIDARPTTCFTSHRVGPLSFNLFELAPIRTYYLIRNTLYFWLYEYHERNVYHAMRMSAWLPKHLIKLLLLHRTRRSEFLACLRGFWDGLCKNMGHRY